MKRTKIEWCDYSINPVKGLCPMACSYCYARRMYKRFKWNPEIRFEPETLSRKSIVGIPNGSKVFVGSAIELFGDWIDDDWMGDILDTIVSYPNLVFIFLTKQPQNLIKWSPFPDNCWVGVSATNPEQYYAGVSNIAGIQAKNKFVSFEPLLEQINGGECAEESRLDSLDEFDWVICGQQTPASKKTEPKISWIQEILIAAHNAGDLPVFIKDNLIPLIEREWPEWKILKEIGKLY